jgi:DNA-binding transcriptional regulator YiaG
MTGDDLREYRHRLGWSQAKLARVYGCSVRTLIRWEQSSHLPDHLGLAMLALAREYQDREAVGTST